MSTKVTEWVLENSRARGSSRLVLLIIADMANTDGFGYAKVSTLVERTKLSRRWVQYSIKRLELSGELIVLEDPGQYHKFFVVMDDEFLELDEQTLEAIRNVKGVPSVDRAQFADHFDNMYATLSDKTRHSLNTLAQQRRRRQSTSDTDTHTPQKKGRGKGR